MAVLHEIAEKIRESVSISQISLESKSQVVENFQGFEIKIRCVFESGSWQCVKPILERHCLGLKVEDEFVIVYSR
jgi:hypothetical protein